MAVLATGQRAQTAAAGEHRRGPESGYAATTQSKSNVLSYGALGLITLIISLPGALKPTLFGDDWFQLVSYPLNGELSCPDRLGPFFRPLQPCAIAAQYAIFGINVTADHLIELALTCLVPLFLYGTLQELFPGRRTLAFVASLLFVGVPTVFVQNWALLTAANLGLIVALAGATLALRSIRSGSIWLVCAATALFAISLSIYELPLGLSGLVALYVVFAAYTRRTLPMWAASFPLVVCVGYTIGRFVAERQVTSNAYGYSVEEQTTALPQLISRFVHGLQTLIELSWADSLDRIGQAAFGRSLGSHASLTVAALCVLLVVCGWAVAKLVDRSGSASSKPRMHGGRQSLVVIGVGLVTLAAGLFPLIAVAAPSLDWEHSHYNPPATIGLALALAGAVDLLARRAARTRLGAQCAFWAITLSLFAIGVASQEIVQSETDMAWLQQKMIWQQLFQLAPDIAPNTTVMLVLPPRVDESAAGPIQSASFAFSRAVQALYGHNDVEGAFTYADTGPAVLEQQGVAPGPGKPVAPYGSVLAFQFDSATGRLSQLTTLTANGEAHSLCSTCAFQADSPPVAERRLVQ